jgi:hypothetical protein
MKNIKSVKNLSFVLLVTGIMFILAGCGSDTPSSTTEAPTTEAPAEDIYVDVYQDLQDAHAVVTDNKNWGDIVWEQIMLADDVPSPEMKYGLLVVPFFPSDLVERHTRTVDINDGNFTIEIISAETGLSWTIDQDGVIAGGN